MAPTTGAVNNSVLVTITGEASATDGTGFPPPSGSGAPFFVDGWEVTYTHVLVTVGEVTLSENPDLNPNDQSVTGDVVARASGAWAVDLAKAGPRDAKEQNGRAWPLVRLSKQDTAGTPSFNPTEKYALGFTLVPGVSDAYDVNLDDDGRTLYRSMIEQGWTVVLQGRAMWRGTQGTPACRSTDSQYDFARFPQAVRFTFGFKAPVDFKNCVNPELSPSDSRGVQTSTNSETVAQLTFHLDHPFWEALEEDAPLRWDALAARKSVATGMGPTSVELSLDDLHFDFQAPRDAQGSPIPWRTCGPTQPNERTSGTVSYDPVNVPVNPAGGAAGLKDLVDYMTYNLSTFGHLNNDGLCFPARQYPAPR